MDRSYLVDPDGAVWDLEAIAAQVLGCVLPTPSSKQELLEGLVIGRGYVGIGLSGTTSYLYLNPGDVTPAAMTAAARELIDRSGYLSVTALYHGRWEYVVHKSMFKALDHVEQLMLQAQARMSDRFRSQAITPTQLANSNLPGLVDVLSMADGCGRVVDQEFIAKVADQTGSCFMVCKLEPGTQAWFVHVGGLGYDRSRYYLARDHLIKNQPDHDREYGLWLHKRYLEVAQNDAPMVEKVDAIIRTQDHGMRRFTYCRLLIPMTDAQQNRLLLTASQRDSGIDLGGDAHSEYARA